MPFEDVNGIKIYYEIHGDGDTMIKQDALKILSLRDDKKTAKVSRLDTLHVLHHIVHQSNVFGFSLPWLDIQNIQWRR